MPNPEVIEPERIPNEQAETPQALDKSQQALLSMIEGLKVDIAENKWRKARMRVLILERTIDLKHTGSSLTEAIKKAIGEGETKLEARKRAQLNSVIPGGAKLGGTDMASIGLNVGIGVITWVVGSVIVRKVFPD
jgi:hypothetical protein